MDGLIQQNSLLISLLAGNLVQRPVGLSRSWALRAAPFALTGAHVGQSGPTDPGDRSTNKSRVFPGRCARGSAPAPLRHRANSAQMLKVGAQVGCNAFARPVG